MGSGREERQRELDEEKERERQGEREKEETMRGKGRMHCSVTIMMVCDSHVKIHRCMPVCRAEQSDNHNHDIHITVLDCCLGVSRAQEAKRQGDKGACTLTQSPLPCMHLVD